MNNSEEKHRKDLEAAKNWYKIAEQQNNEVAMNILKDLFPELHESEDEIIRNFLIDFIKACGWSEKQFPPREDCIAWLEKQAEHKSLSTEETELNSLAFLTELGYTCIPPTKEKPNGWSEEDEEKLNSIIEVLGDSSLLIQWLNSLKDRVQPQQKQDWSEEDESNMDYSSEIIGFLKNYIKAYGCTAMNSWVNWLKSLKDRGILQPKQEWSEEDEKMFDKLYEILYIYGYSSHPEIDLSSNEAINLIYWLKSIKPQKHWKPSEEQLRAIINSVQGLYQCKEKEVLLDLYEQLKNL